MWSFDEFQNLKENISKIVFLLYLWPPPSCKSWLIRSNSHAKRVSVYTSGTFWTERSPKKCYGLLMYDGPFWNSRLVIYYLQVGVPEPVLPSLHSSHRGQISCDPFLMPSLPHSIVDYLAKRGKTDWGRMYVFGVRFQVSCMRFWNKFTNSLSCSFLSLQ